MKPAFFLETLRAVFIYADITANAAAPNDVRT